MNGVKIKNLNLRSLNGWNLITNNVNKIAFNKLIMESNKLCLITYSAEKEKDRNKLPQKIKFR